MPEVVAAVIAASVALLVTVAERLWVAREERRRWELADRRHVYARLAGAVFELMAHKHFRGTNPPEQTSMRAVDALQELELVGAADVVELGREAFTAARDLGKGDAVDELMALRRRFISAARRDLGYDS